MRQRRVLWAGLVAIVAMLVAPAVAPATQKIVTIKVPSPFVDPSTQKFPAQDPAIDATPHPGILQANVLLPDGYQENPRKRYPLLLLFHGAGERWDSWANPQEGDIREVAKDFPGIIVMPDGALGFYLDWWNDGARGKPAWERYIRETLLPKVETTYRVRAGRRWHAVAGFSMGGYGTLLTASQNPGYFGTAVPMSAFADLQAPESVSLFPFVGGNPYEQLFGPSDGFYADAHNPIKLAPNLAHTRMYVFSGNGVPDPAQPPPKSALSGVLETGLMAQNDRLVAALEAAGSDVTYTTHLGTHDWPYWRNDLGAAIKRGLFRPVAEKPSSWTFATAARSGRMWDLRYRFQRQTTSVETFSRAGRKLSATGSGRVTITTAGHCSFAKTLPFNGVTVPRKPCH